MTPAHPLFAMHAICKRFGAVRANDTVDLALYPGDIMGLLGENGAGKTTLMNVLFGVYSPDSGTIEVDGRTADIRSSADALALGIGMVHQHFHLVPRHTVLENLMIGLPGRRGRLDRAAVRGRLAEIDRLYGLKLDPDSFVGDLGIGQQQRLEIIKALFRGARILILDEPTAALTPQETQGLFAALRAMAAKGMGVVFISHKLNEVRAVTNRIVVMRAGKVVDTLANDDRVSEARLAELMCGRELSPPLKRPVQAGNVLLRLDRISVGGGMRQRLREVSLTVRGSEIFGIAGVSGNGQRELADVLAGVLPPTSGTLEVGGRRVTRYGPRELQALGVARVPEDRIGTGLAPTLPLSDNLILPRVAEAPFSRHGILDRGAIQRFAEARIAEFGINAPGPHVRTGTLSGGNLQKALLARELAWDPLVLLAAQPTRGLDVAAAGFVHRRFLDLRARGRAVLLISEDLEEIFALSDRIAVMYEGRVLAVMPATEASVDRIGLLMTGVEQAA